MKRFLTLALAALMVVGCFAGCTKAPKTDEEAGNSETESTKFIVGFDAEFPPYGFKDTETGEYTGFDLDLAKEVCKRNNWEYVAQPINWDGKDGELDSGNISCIWNGFTINGREDKYTWSDPYVDNSQVFVVKKDAGITDYALLADKTVAVQKDSSAQAAINDEANKALLDSFKELITCADYNTAFMDLETGAIDAVAMDIGVAKFQIAGKEDTFVILDEILAEEKYGVGFKLGNTALRDSVQKTLDEMMKDGTFTKIAEKWEIVGTIVK